MDSIKTSNLHFPSLAGMARLLAVLLLTCSWSAQATAPRVAAQMFGEEKKADIVAYQITAMDADAHSESVLMLEIVQAAFKAVDKTPIVDMLPSKHLAMYALQNNDVVAMVGSVQDLADKDRKQYRAVAFYLSIARPDKEPVALLFGSKHKSAAEWHKAFGQGLKILVKRGDYLKMLEKHFSKEHIPANYLDQLKRLNPELK